MELFTRYRATSLWQKLVLWAGLIFVFYTIFGFFILPGIFQKVSVDKLTKILGRQVSISKISFNPYSLCLTLEGLNIDKKKSDQPLFSFKTARVNFQASSVFKLAPVVREAFMDGLYLNIIRHKDQTWNFSDLLPLNSTDKRVVEKKEDHVVSELLKFSISNIVLNNGKIIVNDLLKDKIHAFTEIELAIPVVSNLDAHVDIFVTPVFSVKLNGSPMVIKGKSKPFTALQATRMNFIFKGVDLQTYYDYIPFKTNMDLTGGTMDLSCCIEFSQSEDGKSLPQLFLSGELGLSNFEIKDLDANPLFKMDEFNLSMDRSSVLKGDINIREVALSFPNISLLLDDLNRLNIYDLVAKSSTGGKEENFQGDTVNVSKDSLPVRFNCQSIVVNNALVTLKDVSEREDLFSLQYFAVENFGLEAEKRLVNIGKVSARDGSLNIHRLINNHINLEALLPPQDTRAGVESDKVITPVWNTEIANLVIKGFSIMAKDLISKGNGRISLENIILNSKGLSTLLEKKAESRLSFQVNKKGRIDISGKVGANPLNADVALSADQINLAWFQPFISQYLNLIISGGKFSTSGRFSMQKAGKNSVKAAYAGDIDISDFLAVDSLKAEELVKFKNFGIKGLTLDLFPFSARINTLKLTEPVTNMAVYPDGTLNFSRIAKSSATDEDKPDKPDKPDAMGKSKDSSFPLWIDKVIVDNGEVVFSDRSVTPNFRTRLTRVDAKISGLSAEETGLDHRFGHLWDWPNRIFYKVLLSYTLSLSKGKYSAYRVNVWPVPHIRLFGTA